MELTLKTYRSPAISSLDFAGCDNKEIVPLAAAAGMLAGYAAARAVVNAIGINSFHFMDQLHRVEQWHDTK